MDTGSTGGKDLLPAIIADIQHSDFCVADVSLEQGLPNLNVLVEAGIAVGAGKPLYLIARGQYEQIKRALPSDLNGRLVDTFSPTDSNKWASNFHDLFQRVLRDLGRPEDLAREKPRTSEAQQLVWINGVIEQLRSRCRELFENQIERPQWSFEDDTLAFEPATDIEPST